MNLRRGTSDARSSIDTGTLVRIAVSTVRARASATCSASGWRTRKRCMWAPSPALV